MWRVLQQKPVQFWMCSSETRNNVAWSLTLSCFLLTSLSWKDEVRKHKFPQCVQVAVRVSQSLSSTNQNKPNFHTSSKMHAISQEEGRRRTSLSINNDIFIIIIIFQNALFWRMCRYREETCECRCAVGWNLLLLPGSVPNWIFLCVRSASPHQASVALFSEHRRPSLSHDQLCFFFFQLQPPVQRQKWTVCVKRCREILSSDVWTSPPSSKQADICMTF